MLGASVVLLRSAPGVTPDDKDVLLPRGQVGVVIEARNHDVVIVEFADLDGHIHAQASVARTNLLLLNRGKLPEMAKRKLRDISLDELLDLARQAWQRAKAISIARGRAIAIAQKAGTKIDRSLAYYYNYDEAEDSLLFVVSAKSVVKDVSYGWNMNAGYSADDEVVEVIFLNASALWTS